MESMHAVLKIARITIAFTMAGLAATIVFA
jgi:hypothetical protein